MPLGQWSAGLKTKKINETKEGLGKSQCLKYQGNQVSQNFGQICSKNPKKLEEKVEIFLLNYFEAVER